MKLQTRFYKQRGRIECNAEGWATASTYSSANVDGIQYVGMDVYAGKEHGHQRFQMTPDEAEALARHLMRSAQAMRADHAKREAAQKPVEAPPAGEQAAATTEAVQTLPAPANAAVATYNRFQQGSASYVCRICKKRTRATGYDEETVELCARCLLGCYVENAEADYGTDSEDYKRAVKALEEYNAAHK